MSAFSFTNTDEEGPIRKRNMGSIGPFSEQLCRQVTSATIARGQVNWFNTERRITLAELISLGAATVVDYKTTRFEQVVPPVDVVIDTVGGDTNSALTNAWRRATTRLRGAEKSCL